MNLKQSASELKKELQNNKSSKISTSKRSIKTINDLNLGDSIHSKTIPGIGVIVSKDISKKSLRVAFGKLFADIKESDVLEKLENPKITKKPLISAHKITINPKPLNAPIDIRGIRVEEALITLNHFIDKSLLYGLEKIIIVHGVGSGQLRSAIRKELSSIPACRDWKSYSEHSNDDSSICFLI